MTRERFLVKSFGDNPEGARVGLVKLLEMLETAKSGVVVVPRLGDLKHSMLVDILGEEKTAQFIKQREIVFSDGKKISLCSLTTLKNHKYSNAYLALWGSKETIAAIEPLGTWSALVLVTWLPKDSEQWQKDHAVTVLYDDGKG